MPRVGRGGQGFYQSFKENNAEIDCELACTWVCACRAPLLSKERELQKRPTLHTNLLHIWLGFSHILDKIYKD